MAKANALAKANPDAVVLLVAVELCSLTLLRNDYSKSNFIGSSLFSDGIAACIVKGDNQTGDKRVRYQASSSKLYYDSLEVMGWDFLPSIIAQKHLGPLLLTGQFGWRLPRARRDADPRGAFYGAAAALAVSASTANGLPGS